MRSTLLCLPWLLAVASCSTPPQPPKVDETRKRPANASVAVELQVCKGELQNSRIVAAETAGAAQAHGATLAGLIQQQAQLQDALLAGRAAPADAAEPVAPATANTVYSVRFDFASVQPRIAPDEVAQLAEAARAAPLIVLRGRTDGDADSLADSRIARQRAEAVRSLLLSAGVDASHIRTTWQPVGDPAADNRTPAGRAANRRVEIEIYHVRPQPRAFTDAG